VKVLLDENFPLPLLGVLRQAGIDADRTRTSAPLANWGATY